MPGRFPQIRGGWRCGLCNITYPPNREKFRVCLACHDQTEYISGAQADEDWVDRVAELVEKWEGGDHDTFPTDWLLPPPQAESEGEAGASSSEE